METRHSTRISGARLALRARTRESDFAPSGEAVRLVDHERRGEKLSELVATRDLLESRRQCFGEASAVSTRRTLRRQQVGPETDIGIIRRRFDELSGP